MTDEEIAKEYAEINKPFLNKYDCVRVFKDGAEFGYKKCFEQVRKIVNEDTRLDCIIPELLRLQEREIGNE